MLEVTLLSIGLGARINLLKEEGESARASSRLKSAFLANVSHEMRTPLNVVLGMNDLLGDAKLSREERKYLDVMRGAGESLLALINDLLDISRVEVGGLKLKFVDFEPRALVEQCREMLSHQARARGLELRVQVAENVPEILNGDPDRLRQVIVNLIGNACKFTEVGSIDLFVEQVESADTEADAGKQGETSAAPARGSVKLEFRVSDTGIGIPADKLDLIFESFRQVDDFETRRQDGAGLGLSISRELARLMHGEINAESQPGRGSVFRFTARFGSPLVAGANAASRQDGVPGAGPGGGKVRDILLVDDNQDNRMLFQAFLKKSAHSIDVAVDGLEAVKKFQERRYDIVFMDIQMPKLDGLSATRQIRKWEGEQIKRGARQRRVPIHALSAHALAEEIEKSRAAGCDGHIAKPVRREEILETLADV